MVNIKNQTAKSITNWKIPGIFAGNEPPQWKDNSGSIQRRVVMFSFDKPVQFSENIGDLEQLLYEELPDILVKINRAYREAARDHGNESIYNILPAYFKKTSSDLMASIQPLEAFMDSEEVVYDPEASILMSTFKERIQDYFVTNGFGRQRLSKEFISAPLARRRLVVEKNDNGHEIIKGIGLRDEMFDIL